MNDYKNVSLDSKIRTEELQIDNCGCDCSTEGCCSDSDESNEKADDTQNDQLAKVKQISVTIDGKTIEVNPEDKNIVDVASRAKIGIPAPCYLANRKNGCCNACVIEINGEQKYACTTSPKDGMDIRVNRDDLKSLRKERLLKYNDGIKSGNVVACCSGGE